jgi:hypothetical protein
MAQINIIALVWDILLLPINKAAAFGGGVYLQSRRHDRLTSGGPLGQRKRRKLEAHVTLTLIPPSLD